MLDGDSLVVDRYQREEPFTTLNVDIRNHQNLLESLEQYVKGDLLEAANAYHCEKCNKKVPVHCISVEFNFCRRLFREKKRGECSHIFNTQDLTYILLHVLYITFLHGCFIDFRLYKSVFAIMIQLVSQSITCILN